MRRALELAVGRMPGFTGGAGAVRLCSLARDAGMLMAASRGRRRLTTHYRVALAEPVDADRAGRLWPLARVAAAEACRERER